MPRRDAKGEQVLLGRQQPPAEILGSMRRDEPGNQLAGGVHEDASRLSLLATDDPACRRISCFPGDASSAESLRIGPNSVRVMAREDSRPIRHEFIE